MERISDAFQVTYVYTVKIKVFHFCGLNLFSFFVNFSNRNNRYISITIHVMEKPRVFVNNYHLVVN